MSTVASSSDCPTGRSGQRRSISTVRDSSQPARQCQEMQHRKLSAAVGVAARVAWHPRDENAELGSRRHVHAVQAHAELMHEPERPGRDNRRADPGAERADDVNAVEIVSELVRWAAGKLPTGQVLGELAPR